MLPKTDAHVGRGMGWRIVDMRPYRSKNPTEFLSPIARHLPLLRPGHAVELWFKSAAGSEHCWAILTEAKGSVLTGVIDFPPLYTPLEWGDTILFRRHHVLDIDLSDNAERLESVREMVGAVKRLFDPNSAWSKGALAEFAVAGGRFLDKWGRRPVGAGEDGVILVPAMRRYVELAVQMHRGGHQPLDTAAVLEHTQRLMGLVQQYRRFSSTSQ